MAVLDLFDPLRKTRVSADSTHHPVQQIYLILLLVLLDAVPHQFHKTTPNYLTGIALQNIEHPRFDLPQLAGIGSGMGDADHGGKHHHALSRHLEHQLVVFNREPLQQLDPLGPLRENQLHGQPGRLLRRALVLGPAEGIGVVVDFGIGEGVEEEVVHALKVVIHDMY